MGPPAGWTVGRRSTVPWLTGIDPPIHPQNQSLRTKVPHCVRGDCQTVSEGSAGHHQESCSQQRCFAPSYSGQIKIGQYCVYVWGLVLGLVVLTCEPQTTGEVIDQYYAFSLSQHTAFRLHSNLSPNCPSSSSPPPTHTWIND